MKITIERADGTKVHIEGDEESVTRIARELSPPPAAPVLPYPYPMPELWRLDRIGWQWQPGITWTSDGVTTGAGPIPGATITNGVGSPS